MVFALGGLVLASCVDKGALPVAFCEERLTVSPDGLSCSAHFLICEGVFGCSWRFDCGPNNRGTTTCTCTEDPAQDCNMGKSWEVEEDFCTLPDAGERSRFREAAAVACLGEVTALDQDFSRLP